MPIDLGGRRELNIFKLTYRSAVNGRVARNILVKVPYGSMFWLTEVLGRQIAKGQLYWFRIDVAKPEEIAAGRTKLARFNQALVESSKLTKVEWAA